MRRCRRQSWNDRENGCGAAEPAQAHGRNFGGSADTSSGVISVIDFTMHGVEIAPGPLSLDPQIPVER